MSTPVCDGSCSPVCTECLRKAADEEETKLHFCGDCRSKSSIAEGGFFWRWYDFYAAQGDEALFVCGACRTEEKHRLRVEKDDERWWEEERYEAVQQQRKWA